MSTPTVLGRLEIAELLDVDERTPHAWHSRGLLPPPDHASVNRSPAWDRSTIIVWAARFGRLPERLRGEAVLHLGSTPPDDVKRGGRAAKASMRTWSRSPDVAITAADEVASDIEANVTDGLMTAPAPNQELKKAKIRQEKT